MTTSVWKFPVTIFDKVEIPMPKGARILSVGFQDLNLCFWALVEDEAMLVKRTFHIRGTGHNAEGMWWQKFIGTVIHPSLPLVFHVWEEEG